MERYRAHYIREGTNPFAPNYRDLEGSMCSIVADFPDDTPLQEVEQMAREAAPDGFEFTEATME